jgi:hypothetical protein
MFYSEGLAGVYADFVTRDGGNSRHRLCLGFDGYKGKLIDPAKINLFLQDEASAIRRDVVAQFTDAKQLVLPTLQDAVRLGALDIVHYLPEIMRGRYTPRRTRALSQKMSQGFGDLDKIFGIMANHYNSSANCVVGQEMPIEGAAKKLTGPNQQSLLHAYRTFTEAFAAAVFQPKDELSPVAHSLREYRDVIIRELPGHIAWPALREIEGREKPKRQNQRRRKQSTSSGLNPPERLPS